MQIYNTTIRSQTEIRKKLRDIIISYRLYRSMDIPLQSNYMIQERIRIHLLTIILQSQWSKDYCEQLIYQYREQYSHVSENQKKIIDGKLWTLLWVIHINEHILPVGGY